MLVLHTQHSSANLSCIVGLLFHMMRKRPLKSNNQITKVEDEVWSVAPGELAKSWR